jgi:hypothetical protein
MKKTALIAVTFLLLAITSQAQSPKIKFGIHAGTSIANMKYEMDDISYSPKSTFGIQAGFVADMQLSKHISIQPGINFVQKGMKINDDEGGSDGKYIERISAIEIPVNVLFNSNGSYGNFFVGVGPSISFAVAGKYIEKADGETEKTKMEFGNDEMEDDYRAFDFGLNGMIGFEFKGGLFVAANYNVGLLNRMPGSDNDYGKITSNYGGLRIGYFFNRK